jgi:hypothetical protein
LSGMFRSWSVNLRGRHSLKIWAWISGEDTSSTSGEDTVSRSGRAYRFERGWWEIFSHWRRVSA